MDLLINALTLAIATSDKETLVYMNDAGVNAIREDADKRGHDAQRFYLGECAIIDELLPSLRVHTNHINNVEVALQKYMTYRRIGYTVRAGRAIRLEIFKARVAQRALDAMRKF